MGQRARDKKRKRRDKREKKLLAIKRAISIEPVDRLARAKLRMDDAVRDYESLVAELKGDPYE